MPARSYFPLLFMIIFLWGNTSWAADTASESFSWECHEVSVPLVRGKTEPLQTVSEGVIKVGPFSKLDFQLYLNGGSMDGAGSLRLMTDASPRKINEGDRLVRIKLFELKQKPKDPAAEPDAPPEFEREEVPVTVHQSGGGFDRGKKRRSASGIIDLPQVDEARRRQKVTDFLTTMVSSEVKRGRITQKGADDFKDNMASHVMVHESMYVENRQGKYQLEILLVDNPQVKTVIDVEVVENERTSFFDHLNYKLPD